MDGRLDAVAKAVARGATRRQALRLAGGGLAGALLAAAGLGKRAGAQEEDTRPCDEVLARCVDQVGGACDHLHPATYAYLVCLSGHGGACNAYFESCHVNCGAVGEPDEAFNVDRRQCAAGCPQGGICVAALNPANRLVCRCVSV